MFSFPHISMDCSSQSKSGCYLQLLHSVSVLLSFHYFVFAVKETDPYLINAESTCKKLIASRESKAVIKISCKILLFCQ
jgi:hypothetical protein